MPGHPPARGAPFHHGYWDTPSGIDPDEKSPPRAANETTLTAWDPAPEQPMFKTAAAALTPVGPPAAPTAWGR